MPVEGDLSTVLYVTPPIPTNCHWRSELISSLNDAEINGLSNSKSYNDAFMFEGIENLNKYLKGVIMSK